MIKWRSKNWCQEGAKRANLESQHLPHVCLFVCPHVNMCARDYKNFKIEFQYHWQNLCCIYHNVQFPTSRVSCFLNLFSLIDRCVISSWRLQVFNSLIIYEVVLFPQLLYHVFPSISHSYVEAWDYKFSIIVFFRFCHQ